MPDNLLVAGTPVATDELHTVNGLEQQVPLPHAQRVKLLAGDDSDGSDVSAENPLPVADVDVAAAISDLVAALATVALDPVSLAALESVTATLDPATLAALENITTTLSGAVALDPATLAALEVVTVANPTDVSEVASETSLLDLLGRVGPTASDNLLALLRQIVANTATEVAKVTHLDLTADTLNLSTDNLEGQLATLLGLVAADATVAAVRDRLPAAGTASEAKAEAIRALLAGKLSVKEAGVAPPLGYGQASVTASQGLPAVPGGAVTALVVPRAAIRWRDDGTAPTAAVGMYLAADQPVEYRGGLAAFRMAAVAGAAEVNVSFYGAEA